MNKWMIYNKKISSLKGKINLSDEILRILVNRGIDTTEKVIEFFNTDLKKLHDPFLMKDMDKAVDILVDSIDNQEHIHIVGDYDQDGNSATVTLIKGIQRFNKRLTYAIPDRIEDGYGINKNMVDNAIKIGVDLIITCDNGISAHEAVEYAKAKGIKIIITDHHKVTIVDGDQSLPKADAVLNPQRLDCGYPFKHLCGAGVAYKLIMALYDRLDTPIEETYDLLQFVAMGTVCDVVDLIGENRTIVKEGLKKINSTSNKGLLALISANSWNREIDVYALGFVIGPCINASGRLSTARLGIELFLEEDEKLVESYAFELVRLNNERKELTNKTYEYVIDEIESKDEIEDIIISYADMAHESIVGIVAGRIKEKFNRPVIVFADSKDVGILKGSGRSIDNYDMFSKLNEAKDFMLSFGGHKMAAGMSIEKKNLKAFSEFLNLNSGLTKEDLQKEITIDLRYPIDILSESFIESLKLLEPFGKGNSKPVFADKAVNLLAYKIIGKNKNVIKLTFIKNGIIIECISFNRSDEIEEYIISKFGRENLNNYNMNNRSQNLVDIIYFPQINEFRGERNIQLNLIDIR
ncbi:MAG: single-stranded-DNA-specific exonuclease RecJ [Tissierellia bacterium]|nr:single-stranded-DNA-specific exonuclease RecJ [Tissierellia bacterium]